MALTQLLDLVGPQEIASRLGVAPNTVSMWRARGLLPEPLAIVSNTPVWHWPLVREWADRTGRLPRLAGDDDQSIKISPADIVAAETLAKSASRTLHKLASLRRPKKTDVSGEYDWYRELAPAERERIRSRWTVPAPRGVGPDVLAEELATMIGRTVVATVDVEDVMGEWVQLTRLADAAGSLRNHRYNPARYGGRSLSQLFALSEPGEDDAESRGEADYLAAFAPCRLGVSPLAMDFDGWRTEYEALVNESLRISETMDADSSRFLTADETELFDRLRELVPDPIGDRFDRGEIVGPVQVFDSVRTGYLRVLLLVN
ncbi:MAG: helix-turn-helix transcriptional regulator [Acidimicrobiales bacterium]